VSAKTTNPVSLAGQVARVTGSSRGIGRAIAETMASLGARVVVSSRKTEACEEVASAIREKGGEALVVACNISRKTEVEALVARTTEHWGRVDILVCNAAVNPAFGPLGQLSDEAFGKIVGANVLSNLWLCNLVLPGMAKRGEGAVVLISSIAGMRGTPTIGAYGMSKAADFALARNLAVEWGPKGIRVNSVAPGLVKTDFARALWENPELREIALKQTPLQRLGEPEDIAGAALFLASDDASFVTGHVLTVDGGWSIARYNAEALA
jgi:NAD(P)-dependent dehydrogenase (short-subunit alcohol dehydrogenase family)